MNLSIMCTFKYLAIDRNNGFIMQKVISPWGQDKLLLLIYLLMDSCRKS